MSTKIIVPTVLATVNPTVSDDRSTGMHVGFRWLNTTTPAEYVCTNDAVGAAVWSSVGGGGGGAPTTAQYLTLATDGTLTNERVLTAGSGISFSDGGAGGALTINGAPSSGIVQQLKDTIDETDRSTTSTSYVASGLTITFDNNLKKSTNKVRVRFVFRASGSVASFISFTLKRNGNFITPAGSDYITSVSINSADFSTSVVLEFYNSPATITPGAYELWWKTDAGTARINFLAAASNGTPCIMTLEEIDPLPSTLEAQTSVALLRDEKAQNTAGGTFTSGSWVTRTLNTEVDPADIVSLASNEFTLPTGTYVVSARAPATSATGARHQIRLYNVTAAAVAVYGSSAYALTAQNDSSLEHVITVTVSTVFRIEHRTDTTQATNGLGAESNLGTEVYTQVRIEKIAGNSASQNSVAGLLFLAERFN